MSTDSVVPSRASLVQQIHNLVAHPGLLTRGDVASLRRMDPARPASAFFKVEALVFDSHLPGDAAARTDLETRWAAITIGLVHLGSLHQPGKRLGAVLAESGFSPIRFARLVRADAERVIDEVVLLARFLASKGTPVDWTGAAHLVLSAGRPDEEGVRRHLARDYFGMLARHGEQ